MNQLEPNNLTEETIEEFAKNGQRLREDWFQPFGRMNSWANGQEIKI